MQNSRFAPIGAPDSATHNVLLSGARLYVRPFELKLDLGTPRCQFLRIDSMRRSGMSHMRATAK